MNGSRSVALVAGVVLLVSACQNDRPLAPVMDGGARFQAQQGAPGYAPDRAAVARLVPGFGGIFLDQSGIPTVYLTDVQQRGAAQSALATFIRSQGVDPSQLRVLPGRFDYLKLDEWHQQLWPRVFELNGIILSGVNERLNAVLVGVDGPAAAAPVRALAAQLGIPEDALVVEEMEPFRPLVSLRQQAPSIQGGYQIHFSQYVCTLGFLALHSAAESFITNSHCTATQGGTEGTVYYQPTSSVDPTVIGLEADDPEYWTGGICPRNKRCRYSDAARVGRQSNRSFDRGYIARTSAPNNGSLEVTGAFEITAKAAQASVGTNCPVLGTSLNKIGRTTGWTQGTVTNTCVHVGVLGSNIQQLYQVIVGASVDGGDSGSPVFGNISGSNVTLYGILWGGSSSSFVYSPLVNVEHELGALTVTSGGSAPPPTSGTVSGKVTKQADGLPLQGATVSVGGTSLTATTNSSGDYSIANVPAGTYNVSASASGYESQTQTGVSVTGGSTSTVDFSLQASEPPPTQTVGVASINYSGNGGPQGNRHLQVSASVTSSGGSAVSGASVTIRVLRDGSVYATNTGSTGSAGTVGFTYNNAPSGCYTSEVQNVSASGFTWDGVTPANGPYCK